MSGITPTFAENVRSDRLLQPANTLFPMFTTLAGTTARYRLVQPENAPEPMLITEPGIVTLVRDVLPLNTLSLIPVTVSGIVMSPPLPVYAVSSPFSMINPRTLFFCCCRKCRIDHDRKHSYYQKNSHSSLCLSFFMFIALPSSLKFYCSIFLLLYIIFRSPHTDCKWIMSEVYLHI